MVWVVLLFPGRFMVTGLFKKLIVWIRLKFMVLDENWIMFEYYGIISNQAIKTHLHYSNWKIFEDFLVFWERGHLVIFLYILSAFYGVYKRKFGDDSNMKWAASSRWSFSRTSTCGSIQRTTIGTTHPTLFVKTVPLFHTALFEVCVFSLVRP